LPFLRFSRDKRGYETTALVHAFRGRQGRTRQKLLYWFRTPPNIKVGRPALDQDAIRWIEEHNPEIDFDWPKILEAAPTPAPVEEPKVRRGRRGRPDRGAQAAERRERPRRQPEPAPTPSPVEEAAPEIQSAPVITPEQEAIEQIARPDVEEIPVPPPPAVDTVLGHEQLIRFRARYAELQARIIERGGEPEHVESLRTQAESLNPDSWVTEQEVRKGMEEFETKIRELRAALGLRRRRRSRRGGRRHRGGRNRPPVQQPGVMDAVGAPQTEEPTGSSDSYGDGAGENSGPRDPEDDDQ